MLDVPATRGMRWQVPAIVFMLMFWEGFPFSLFGMPMVFGYQLFAGIIYLGFGLHMVRAVRRNAAPNAWELTSLAFFAWCVVVSYNYSTNIMPQSTQAWLPAIFTVAPLLMIFFLNVIDATRQDVERALMFLALFASFLVILDRVTGANFLAPYARGSAFSDGRVILFKYPLVFGFILTAMRAISARSIGKVTTYAIAATIMAYNITILTESRLAMAAIAIAIIPIFIFCIRGDRKLFLILVGPLVLIPVVSSLIDRYFGDFRGLDSYFAADVSASFRQYEIDYFSRHFETTSGMGFGFMSGDPAYDNVLTFAAQSGGELVGYGSYGMALVDTGLYAALYQFGWVGLLFTLVMTLIAGWVLATSYRYGPAYSGASACGFVLLAFLLSPVPFNGFTIFASAHMGAVLWFMASQISQEQRAALTQFAQFYWPQADE